MYCKEINFVTDLGSKIECVTQQDKLKNSFLDLSVTELREISSTDFEEYSVTDLHHLFEAICFKLEDLENQKEDFIQKDLDTDYIEDNIYELDSLQYDVQSQIECL